MGRTPPTTQRVVPARALSPCPGTTRNRTIRWISPTVFRYRGYRFFFFSREEDRPHVHVSCADGEAKFWLAPEVSLAGHWGLSPQQLAEVRTMVEERRDEIAEAWQRHFRR